ncbi:unnamed protein product [Leptosia nina]|uniref:Prolylcarboxypeptidase n=1 Tax=Leptosia nina TaxID=320188 RepID=A0AAV1IVV7_9NEOP
MKVIILASLLCVVTSAYPFSFEKDIYSGTKFPKDIPVYFTNTECFGQRVIQLPLDHFNEKDDRTFNLTYALNINNFKPGGPIYLVMDVDYIGIGEYYSSQVNRLARETNGAVFLTERRYGANSRPFERLDPKNLQWLNTKQIMADYETLIRNIKKDQDYSQSKVVLYGLTRGGKFATWMRLLKPDLVDAVVASSATLLAKKDAKEVLEYESNLLKRFGTGCYDKAKTAFSTYEKMLKTVEGREKIKTEFNVCPESDLSIPENQYFMMDLIKMVSYNGELYCKENSNHDQDFKSEIEICNDVSYEKYIDSAKALYLNFHYQDCFEFGHFKTTSSKNQVFGNSAPLHFFTKMCKDLYDTEFDEAKLDKNIELTNKLYGGNQPNVTKVIFVNGELDGASTLSILEDLSAESPAIVIPDQYKIADAQQDSWKDSEELRNARKKIRQTIKSWIGSSD